MGETEEGTHTAAQMLREPMVNFFKKFAVKSTEAKATIIQYVIERPD